jgi:hypothetical protein
MTDATDAIADAATDAETGTTIEQLKSVPATLAEQARQDELAKRREAAERYRELLRRNENPEDGDTLALRECMTVLGRGVSDLPDDLELMAVLDAMDAARHDQEELAPQLSDARRRRDEASAVYAAERDEVQARHAELMRQADAEHGHVSALIHAASRTITQPGRHKARWQAMIEGRVDRD